MIHKFKIDNDYLSQTEYFDGVSGNKNVYICEFEINCDESGAVWFAVFKKDDETYVTTVTDGKCTFPHECLTDPCTVYLGCYAECEENKRISTNWIPLNVKEGAYSQGTAPEVPSKDLWETLLSNSVPVIGENGHWYTYDIQEEEYLDTCFAARGEQGPKGDKGDKGDTGESGYTPQKGVDYFTQADIDEAKEETLGLLCPKTETTSLAITDALPHNAIDYTICGNTGGVGDLVVYGDSDYAEYGGKYRIPVSVRGKNLLDSSLLMNSENYTLNSWYSGAYKAVAVPVPNGTYVFSTKHLSGFIQSDMTLSVTSYIDTNPNVPSGAIYESTKVYYDKKITLTVTEGYIYFSAFHGTTSNLEEFYSNVQVILEKGSAGTAYEPYIAPQTVNIYLADPIEEGQSISLADTNVPIPLISRDTNIIEFGTSVQPSSVKIKYYQDINKVIANLQALILNH